jgi:hypothetical protein
MTDWAGVQDYSSSKYNCSDSRSQAANPGHLRWTKPYSKVFTYTDIFRMSRIEMLLPTLTKEKKSEEKEEEEKRRGEKKEQREVK